MGGVELGGDFADAGGELGIVPLFDGATGLEKVPSFAGAGGVGEGWRWGIGEEIGHLGRATVAGWRSGGLVREFGGGKGWGEELGDALIGDGVGGFFGEGGEDFGDGIFGGETVFLAEDIDGAVFDELVWPADADHGDGDPGVVEVFDDRAAEAIVEDMIFESAEEVGAPGEEIDGIGVEGFDPAGVDHGGADALGFEDGGGLFGDLAHPAEAEEGDFGAMFDDFGVADFEDFGLEFGDDARADAAGVADGDGAARVVDHRPEHIDELVFVFGLHVDEIGDVAEVPDIEEAVVGGAVVAAEATAIHAEGDIEALEGHVVDDHVVRPLHESGVDGEERFEALGGEAAGEEGGVFFGDADIIIFVGMFGGEVNEAGACGHGAGDGAEFVIGVGEFGEGMAEEFGVGGGGSGGGGARFGFELPEAVKFVRFFESWGVAFAFLGKDVKDDGFVLGFEEFERADEEGDIMAIDGAVVAEAEVLEDHAGEEEIFDTGLDFVGDIFGELAADHFDEAGGFIVEMGVRGVGGDFIEVGGDGADIFGDRPFVIVEDDDEFFGGIGDIIEGFVADAAGESGIASDTDHVFVGAPAIATDGHAEGGAEGGAGVTCAVGIVGAFAAEEEAIEAFVLADGVEALASTGEEFVDVALVGDIENEFIGGGLEDAMEGDGEFDHPEIGAEMATDGGGIFGGEDADEFVADFLGELGEIGFGEGFDVVGGIDGREESLRHLAVELKEADVFSWAGDGFFFGIESGEGEIAVGFLEE